MFDSIKEAVNKLVDKEIEKRKAKLINDVRIKKGKVRADIELLKANEISKYYDESFCGETVQLLFRDPHFTYKVLDDDPDEDRHYTIMAWLSEDINTGVVVSIDSYDDEATSGFFKVHRRGKTGRGVKSSSIYDSEKNFIKHYDNFVADLVLLGLDEISTESKEPYENK